ncbi:A/G-specific adenine glycosylase [Desulforamulus putei]|uniref:Adenine DNA glycosylase n=1 Tax=Desulforamulus putei DSM 12395 TaxID=1121429 RepID=A0A1M4XZN4_9FIRM|nr:A/G-specific adenine glycosylase [Desulforamulus putei]SHE98763.1 A/G-specific DNA-adenine glycosylase [Desulforamulus putei DSM 12395]
MDWVKLLLNWYLENKRDLPWRRQKDAYAIWISEIMLQQTRVDTVLAYYTRFLERFPTVRDLAQADIDEVLKYWEGLGYYTRAKNMHKAAGEIVRHHQGVFPQTYREVLALPGIGPYTAGAVMSIAYNQPYPAVDGNVLRVMSRLYLLKKDISQPAVKKEVENLVKQAFPAEQACDFTQALIELGALVCLPTAPKCFGCPIRQDCKAFQENLQNALPSKQKKPARKSVIRYIALIQQGDRILMNKRPADGLLGGLWEFPGVEGKNKKEFCEKFKIKYGVDIFPDSHWMDTKHEFTHLIWEMKIYRCRLDPAETIKETRLQWIPLQELNTIAIPTAFQKIKNTLLNTNSSRGRFLT